jgi:hypothetical protein
MGTKEETKIFLDFINELKDYYKLHNHIPKGAGSIKVCIDTRGVNCLLAISDTQFMDIDYRFVNSHVTAIIGHKIQSVFVRVPIDELDLEVFHKELYAMLEEHRKIAVENYMNRSSFLDEIITGLENL